MVSVVTMVKRLTNQSQSTRWFVQMVVKYLHIEQEKEHQVAVDVVMVRMTQAYY